MSEGEGLIPGLEDVPGRAEKTRESGAKRPAVRRKGAPEAAAELPVARVAVDVPLAHLDRPFDYLVPAKLDAEAVPGCRVRVRFAGQLVDGYLLERVAGSEHGGRLLFLERVTSAEAVLTPEIGALARELADRHAGTLSDVLRLAVPPRHARAEKRRSVPGPSRVPAPADPGPWADYPAGPSFLAALAEGRSPRAVWTALPGPDWPAAIARAARAALASGRGTLIVVADGREAARVETALAHEFALPAGTPATDDALDVPDHAPTKQPPAPAETTTPPDSDATEPTSALGEAAMTPDSGTAEPTSASAEAAMTPDSGAMEPTSAPGEAAASSSGAEETATAQGSGTGETVAVSGEAGASGSEAGEAGPAWAVLTAEAGPEKRYREWLRVLRGAARVVVGTRAAVFAPVRELGLVVLWDDGDDVHAEPHAPYAHAREVLALRAHRAGAAVLFGGISRTADTTRLVAEGWAHGLVAARETVRSRMPRIRPAGDDAELARDEAARTARLPALAFRTAREALADGPVLVQVPRRGYLPALACRRCREPARCTACAGPLALASSHSVPNCLWCGRLAGDWRCGNCGDVQVRAIVVGAGRTAEELGRAFPGVSVRTSGRDGVLASVGSRPELVVSTPGAEPVAEEGYAAALLLDGWALLGRADLRANEEALRRWLNAAALVRPQGRVVLVADSALPVVQAAVRWDPVTFAERELAERAELRFPPAARMASLTGTPEALRDFLAATDLPPDAEVLGPVLLPDGRERALLRVPFPAAPALSRALKATQGVRSARKATDPVRVEVDPLQLL
ncbi:primosomal protein N' [Actinocorallia libanotica]|uniref:Probable replication restart protein PriA n=1 Tax=Actinocorallia libanotica TaxID=46162 RepID=A0ABP4BSW8_9ACTN